MSIVLIIKMFIKNYEELVNLTESEYSQVEIINCYVNSCDSAKCKQIVKKLTKAKVGLIRSAKEIHVNFGSTNYLSKDKTILVIGYLSVCKTSCQNCISCFNMEFLSDNYSVNTLIINKIGFGSNEILNSLSPNIKYLRVGEYEETYELTNLPYELEQLDLLDNKQIDIKKIKLPFNCKFNLVKELTVKELEELNKPVIKLNIGNVALE